MPLVFEPMPLPADRMSYVDNVPGLEPRLTLVTLTDTPAADCWASTFAPTGAALAATELGRVELAAPFLPTSPAPTPPSTSCADPPGPDPAPRRSTTVRLVHLLSCVHG